MVTRELLILMVQDLAEANDAIKEFEDDIEMKDDLQEDTKQDKLELRDLLQKRERTMKTIAKWNKILDERESQSNSTE